MADGWIELFDVETDGPGVLFVFSGFETVDYGCGIFFHWLKLRFFAIVLLMRSRIFLPILPISDFVELMSLACDP